MLGSTAFRSDEVASFQRVRTLEVAVSVGFLVLFMPGLFFAGEALYLRDLETLHEPLRWVMVESARDSGWPPLWNEYAAAGQPLAANPHYGVFHPLGMLFFLLPWRLAFSLQALVPLVATFLGMGALLRRMGCSRLPAVVGSVSWAFGGVGLSLVNLLPMLWTVAPLPWALAFALRVTSTQAKHEETATRSRAFGTWNAAGPPLGLAIALAFIAIGGEPATMLGCGMVVAATIAVRSMRGSIRSAVPAVLSMILAAGLAACVLVPAVGLAAKSMRTESTVRQPSGDWSLPAVRVAEVVSPPLDAWPQQEGAEGRRHQGWYPVHREPLVASLYPGFLIAVLAIVGCATSPRTQVGPISLAVFAIALAMGPASPIWRVVSGLPLFSMIRFPEKWAIFAAFAAVLAGSLTLQHVLRGSTKEGFRLLRQTLWTAISCGVLWIAVAWKLPGGSMDTLIRGGGAMLFGCAALAVLWRMVGADTNDGRAPSRTLRVRVTGGAVIVVLLVADLWIAGRALVPTRSPDPEPRAPQFLRQAEGSVSRGFLFHRASQNPTLGHEAWMTPPPMSARWGFRTILDQDLDGTQLTWSRDLHREFAALANQWPALELGALARLGGAFVSRLVAPDPAHPDIWGVYLSPVDDPAPFASCVDDIVRTSAPSEWAEAAAEHLAGGNRTFVVVDQSVQGVPDVVDPCRIHGISRSPTRIDMELVVAGPKPAILQVNQTWDPGWRVRLDGEVGVILRRDLALSAVVLPVGTRRVALEYRDPLVELGLVISGLSTTVLLALGFLWVRRTRFEKAVWRTTPTAD